MKLNLKDKRILYELDINSKQSLSQLAKEIKLPKTVIHYRINLLKEKGILKNTYALVNFAKLGYTQYKIYIKFQSISPTKEKEIINDLIKRNHILWVTTCRGQWDISITIIAKNIIEFDKNLKEIINKYGRNIQEKEILVVSYSSLYSRNYILPEKEKKEFPYMEKIENIKITETEYKILKILANNSRIQLLKIMKELSLTRDIIGYRIKKLEKQRILLSYRSLINLKKIDYNLYKVIFRFNNFSKEEENTLLIYCKSFKNITQYLRLAGSWDVEIEIEIEDEEKLYEIINEIRNKFSKIIKDFRILHIVEEHKLNFFPL